MNLDSIPRLIHLRLILRCFIHFHKSSKTSDDQDGKGSNLRS